MKFSVPIQKPLSAAFTTLVLLLGSGCADEPVPATGPFEPDTGTSDAAHDADPSPPDDASADAVVDPGNSTPRAPTTWVVHIADNEVDGVGWAADDVVGYLRAMGREVSRSSALEPQCVSGSGAVLFGPDISPDHPAQTYSIQEARCGDGTVITLSGAGLLGRQYAAYELMHIMGVRFFHPEQEYIPREPVWHNAPISRLHTPDFQARSVSLHLTHPLELGDTFRAGIEELEPEGVRYIDWQLKNLASAGQGGIGTGENQTRGLVRGFPSDTGMSLHSQQQGGRAVYDPDDPRPLEEQLAEAIEARMQASPSPPDRLGLTFNPSEFTELDDEFVVRELTFIANYVADHYPETELYAINHGTAGEPTPNYGVRYYDLPQFAPPNLGVRVHTLMFFDLFRPAPVYGNRDFNHLFSFMAQEYQKRNLIYFPEAAWWLTFDIAVPLYLPITIEARDVDIQGIKYMLGGKLVGHRTFGTGHEWGYWQNEYCSLRMAADVDYRYTDCLADIASPMGSASDTVVEVLQRVIRYQERDLIYGELIPFLVGTDPETEVALLAGVHLHDLPPAIPEILTWSSEELTHWRTRIAPALEQMDADYEAEVQVLRNVQESVPEDGLPWFNEILDGVEVTGIRARHALHVYGAVVSLRTSQLEDDQALAGQARTLLERARADTIAAQSVISRREAGYRYQPLSRAVGGGPDSSQDDNWTVYPYRYLNRTHHGYYYTRIDRLAEQALSGTAQAIDLPDSLIGPDQSLAIDVIDPEAEDANVDWGDGQTDSGRRLRHTYDAPGVYAIRATSRQDGEAVELQGDVAQLISEVSTGFTGSVRDPAAAALIDGLLPAIVFGRITNEHLAVGFDIAGQGLVGLGGWQLLDSDPDGDLISLPQDIVVPIVNRSTRQAITSLTVIDGVFSALESELVVIGQLPTEDVVQALVDIGGFDTDGARRLVASTLGFTPDTLPQTVPFRIQWQVQ